MPVTFPCERLARQIRPSSEAALERWRKAEEHYHTVEAPSREALNEIKEALEAAGFLVK